MNNKPVFYDTDCLSSFLVVDRIDLLKKEFSSIIVSAQVNIEFLNDKTPKCIYERFSNWVDEGFVIVKDIDVDDEVMGYYITFITEDDDGGKGELSSIAFAIVNNGILASNNFRDICKYVKKYNLCHITTATILLDCFKKEYVSSDEVEKIWQDMLKKYVKLPKKSFIEYYKWDDPLCS